MHAIKAYYWIQPPRPADGVAKVGEQLLSHKEIVEIRALILQIIDRLMFHIPPSCEEKDLNRDEEVQCLFNFISTVNEVCLSQVCLNERRFSRTTTSTTS